MSQLVERLSQPEMGGAHFFQRRLEAERFQEYGWQEPYESRGSRTVLRGTGGEIPPVYPTIWQVFEALNFYRYHNVWKIVCGPNTGKITQGFGTD